MKIIKQYIYDNNTLDYWDIVILDDEKWCYRLWMVTSTYHDWNTDCSWHYVKLMKWRWDIDVCWNDIAAKLVWEEVWIIKNLILTWGLIEDKDDRLIKIQEDIDYYTHEIKEDESSLRADKNLLEKALNEYKKITWKDREENKD